MYSPYGSGRHCESTDIIDVKAFSNTLIPVNEAIHTVNQLHKLCHPSVTSPVYSIILYHWGGRSCQLQISGVCASDVVSHFWFRIMNGIAIYYKGGNHFREFQINTSGNPGMLQNCSGNPRIWKNSSENPGFIHAFYFIRIVKFSPSLRYS